MIKIRPSEERGRGNVSWLDSYFTFSFGDYYDGEHVQFSALRVINEDTIAPSQGFATHGHRDMEIVTYVLDGALEHKDSIGNGSIMRPGDVQRMSAGTGILHSEYNPSPQEPVHLLQIWIVPDRTGLAPSYEQTYFPPEKKLNQLKLVAAPDGQDGAVTIHQNAKIYASILMANHSLEYLLPRDRRAWLQITEGALTLNGNTLKAGDGAALSEESKLTIVGQASKTEFLLFDLP
ncbi:MAG: pirin family protein [Synechococcaceae cyanobacterium RL_1_2]|nr:pirin family protein [Synechococcaceae cyanobacterium RL_1_2]